jgi:hypothetical protein
MQTEQEKLWCSCGKFVITSDKKVACKFYETHKSRGHSVSLLKDTTDLDQDTRGVTFEWDSRLN